MTIREVINRRLRKLQTLSLACFLVFFGSIFVAQAQNRLWPITIVAFALFFGTTLYRFYGLRCPRCRGTIGMSITQSGAGFSVPQKFRFCPFCGVSLDAQCDATSET